MESSTTAEYRGSPSRNRPATADEITASNVRTIAELEEQAKADASFGERVSEHIAAFCGSVRFIWIHVLWFGGWIFCNTSPVFHPHPDPFPFTFLTLVVSLEAIFLSAFILISQNRENRITDRRSHLDLQINLLTEQENSKMLSMLHSIAEKVGASVVDPPEIAALEEATRPARVLDQIDKAEKTKDKEQGLKRSHRP